MKIVSSSFVLYFPVNIKVRESIFELEKRLSDYQKPFTLVSVPEDAPIDFPRIIATTNHFHSQLLISANSIQLRTNFDGDYPKSIEKCLAYVNNKVLQIKEALLLINEENGNPVINYSGLTFEIDYGKDDGINDPVRFLMDKHISENISLPVDEAGLRLALKVKNMYYVNIMLQSYRHFFGQPDERGSLTLMKKDADYLKATIDINDKYAFNYVKNYQSSDNAIDKVLQLMQVFVTDYITEFINTGKINYVSE